MRLIGSFVLLLLLSAALPRYRFWQRGLHAFKLPTSTLITDN